MKASRPTRRWFRLLLWALFFLPGHAFSGGVVTQMDQAALVGAMAGGGTVTFAVDGVIGLTSAIVVASDTVLDATGHNITIDGGNAVSLFTVNSGVNFVLTNLTLANGSANGAPSLPGLGGAICNTGMVVAVQCVFTNNSAQGYPSLSAGYASTGLGGAIYNTGTAVAVQCVFANNTARGFTNAVNAVNGTTCAGQGGAVYNAGTLIFSNSILASNAAVGSAGATGVWYLDPYSSPGQEGSGGAIYNNGNALVANCQALGNLSSGGLGGAGVDFSISAFPGENGGPANGGAICNSGILVVSNSTFMQNTAAGGSGGAGGNGPNNGASGQLGLPGALGGAPGNGSGGALCCVNGNCVVVNRTFWSNSAVGGTGGNGGNGNPGASYDRWDQGGDGGDGANGGNGVGGAFCSAGGSLNLNYATITSNSVAGGAAGMGGQGGWFGYPTVAGAAGTNGVPGAGQGDSLGCTGGTLTVQSCILAANAATRHQRLWRNC